MYWVLVAACSLFTCGLCILICGKWDLVPWPEIEPWPPVFGTQSFTHWTTREVPSHIVLIPGYNELYWIFSLVKMLTSQHSHRTCSVGRWSSSSVLFGHLKTSCRKGLPAVIVALLQCQDSVNCWETKNLLMHWLGTGCLEIRLQLQNLLLGFPGGSVVKNSPVYAGDARDTGLTLGSGRSSGEGNINSLDSSCLENPMDRGAWWATVRGVINIQARLSTYHCRTYYTIILVFMCI